MDIERWQRIQELFHDASQLHGLARSDFLISHCHGDDAMLREVNSLLTASEGDHRLFEQPTFDLGITILAQSGALEGQTLGHYRIRRMLGEGGMGEVYLAEDSVLDRFVALKFLFAGLFDDLSAKDQLMREARAVAKLEHPNICAVYGLESIGDYDFIVMPYIEGETLDAVFRTNPPALDHLLDLSEQIASALAAAHARGIVHRDVKPQNILIDKDGRPKILDFGLAKFVPRPQGVALIDKGPTASQIGLVPGTVAYMSPEQTRGEKLDCATDIFSFGIVLHEMLSRSHPFLHETREQTLAAIAKDEPPALPETLPPGLKAITRKCLQKSVTSRYATAEDLLSDLRGLQRERAHASQTAWHKRLRLFGVTLALLLLVLLGAGGLVWRKATRIHTLAILPIANQSGDKNYDYMSVGLTRSLFDRFASIPKLKVKLTTAAPAAEDPAYRAGRDLQVESVLSGDIIKEANRLRWRLRLTSATDGKVTWEQKFDVQDGDLFALQDAVASSVTSKLDLWLIGDEKKALIRRPTDNEEAMKAYILGMSLFTSRRDRSEMRTAISYFDQAIALDPLFAEAYAARAQSHTLTATNVLYGPVNAQEAISKANFDARKAIEINPLLAEAHTALANIDLKYNWNWTEAEREYNLAIQLDPNYAPAHFFYSTLLAVLRRFDESIAESFKGKNLDPYSPVSAVNYARALYFARRFDEAREVLQEQLDQNPDCGQCLHSMGWFLVQQGRIQEAIPMFERRYAKDPLHTAAALGYADARAGKTEDAKRMFEVLDKSPEPVPSHERALIYLGLRDWDQAFTYFRKSCDERFQSIPMMRVDALYDELHGDSRFDELVKCGNVPN
ncbi:MAG TPA: protein kinase [Pyrinomonadaceae bacterium]|nr:protein kinase [Pyrinomonadaceae bacterium]